MENRLKLSKRQLVKLIEEQNNNLESNKNMIQYLDSADPQIKSLLLQLLSKYYPDQKKLPKSLFSLGLITYILSVSKQIDGPKSMAIKKCIDRLISSDSSEDIHTSPLNRMLSKQK